MQIKDANKSRRGSIVLAAVCLALQVMISPNIGMGNGRINFALIFAAIYALTYGGKSAVVVGFFAGLVYDLLATNPIGLMAGLLTILSYALGREERDRFADGTVSVLSAFGTGSFLAIGGYHLAMILLGDSSSVVDLLMLRILPTFAMTFLGFLPFAYLELRRVAKARGKHVGAKSHGLRENYYDIRNL
ncbi:MAG: rod shape-determining protein MreD [Atopobiaceae bacterium]|jgi:rod shape-determining protein MreD|nr:rod shape-determining protein MreD [Atopobiaceae bacterium]